MCIGGTPRRPARRAMRTRRCSLAMKARQRRVLALLPPRKPRVEPWDRRPPREKERSPRPRYGFAHETRVALRDRRAAVAAPGWHGAPPRPENRQENFRGV